MSNSLITKSDVKFWLAILGIVATGVIAFTSLKKDVEAMVGREQINKCQFDEMVKIVKDTHDKVIIMETNLGYIMRELGINTK